MSDKQKIYDYLKGNKHMSLATASPDGMPEVATVQYVLDSDDLLINTFTHYRKYQNLLDNPWVACVVTTGHDATLQFNARAELLDAEAAVVARQKLLESDPDFNHYFDEATTRFFKITPTWMRLRDYTGQQGGVVECVYESD